MKKVCAKTEMMRLILRLYPEWQKGDAWVRLDRDGEVISGTEAKPTSERQVTSHGHLFGQGCSGSVQETRIPHFVSKGPNWDVIGHKFNRFEYEIFRAKVLSEQEQEDG